MGLVCNSEYVLLRFFASQNSGDWHQNVYSQNLIDIRESLLQYYIQHLHYLIWNNVASAVSSVRRFKFLS